ncbi:hypothetical protein FOS14_21295 [Skermania sp. ID1734]|uniref:hypothetical protein n=1 Tax=Skermania sp. ID1734 TaxID=2597516 RepID=UPI001180BE7B|nr:hypothetical protein [Skermania sp. ID1734]TSD94066.1 hypothetical protein FOS14_21295 [Skermania sp. ID1734]
MAATATTTTTPTPLTDAVTKAGDQLVSAVRQGQKVTLDLATSLAEATNSVQSGNELIPGVPALADIQAVWIKGYDVAIELLTLQRDFSVNVAAAVKPADPA